MNDRNEVAIALAETICDEIFLVERKSDRHTVGLQDSGRSWLTQHRTLLRLRFPSEHRRPHPVITRERFKW